jgi:hypothetical protein
MASRYADCMLRIDSSTDEVSVIDITYEKYFDNERDEESAEAQQERKRGGSITVDPSVLAMDAFMLFVNRQNAFFVWTPSPKHARLLVQSLREDAWLGKQMVQSTQYHRMQQCNGSFEN